MAAVLPRRLGCTISLMRRVARHIGFDDRHRAVGAAAGNDDDLGDSDSVQMLIQQRIQQGADVGLFVVGRYADAA